MPGTASALSSPPQAGLLRHSAGLATSKLWRSLAALTLLVWVSGCQPPNPAPTRSLNIQQSWELNPGDKIGERTVTGSLGDVSIDLGGARLYAPFSGKVEPAPEDHCVIYSTAEIPAYLFRFCGLRRPRFGPIRSGQAIGAGAYLQFATLRRQPDGTWIIVEPSTGVLERAIDPDAQPTSDLSATTADESATEATPQAPAAN